MLAQFLLVPFFSLTRFLFRFFSIISRIVLGVFQDELCVRFNGEENRVTAVDDNLLIDCVRNYYKLLGYFYLYRSDPSKLYHCPFGFATHNSVVLLSLYRKNVLCNDS